MQSFLRTFASTSCHSFFLPGASWGTRRIDSKEGNLPSLAVMKFITLEANLKGNPSVGDQPRSLPRYRLPQQEGAYPGHGEASEDPTWTVLGACFTPRRAGEGPRSVRGSLTHSDVVSSTSTTPPLQRIVPPAAHGERDNSDTLRSPVAQSAFLFRAVDVPRRGDTIPYSCIKRQAMLSL